MTEQNDLPMQEQKPAAVPPKADLVGDLYEMTESFVLVLAVLLTVCCFLVRPATVFGSSMLPTLHGGEWLMLQQVGYNDPQYGDIVVIDRTQTNDDALVKRVIGRAGDVIYIDFDSHEVWRNDEKLDEPYINEPTALQYDVKFPVRVPDGKVFVMGDNRNASDDSRDSRIGMIDTRRVMGKAIFRFLPLQKAGGIA